MAFWLSSPLIDPPSVPIAAAAVGWEFAVAMTVAAVAMGLMGGFAVMTLCRRGSADRRVGRALSTEAPAGAYSGTLVD